MAIQTELQPMINRDMFSNYYLKNLLPESNKWESVEEEEVKEAFEGIKEIYDKRKNVLENYTESDIKERFIVPILKELGFSVASEETIAGSGRQPDFALFKEEELLDKALEKKEEDDFYKKTTSLLEAKKWDRNLDKRGAKRDFSNPSHQIYVYLQETPVEWGILTNGRKWRLYYSKTSHKLDSYFEIDLPTVLEEEDLELFKYFYLLFRTDAFVEDQRGECFLDKVYERSNLFSQELGEDLKENIYEAIRLLAEGFLEYPENDLHPKEDKDLIHDSSLIYLYRMIFVLYAESEGRDLLDTYNRVYNDSYSLNSLKQEVCEELEDSGEKYKYWQSDLWHRLEELFELIDKGSKNKGIPEDELYIPAYNGGLFNTEIDDDTGEEIKFLQENKVGDSYLSEVIDLLTRHESKNGEGRVFVDYSSLDIRHLGSIYEGLLEYELNVAPEPMIAVKEDDEEKWYSKEEYEGDGTTVEELDEGEVYLTTDKGERKATGSYYTPEYIVQYIVENTLDPILDEIREDLLRRDRGDFAEEFAERVFELKVLDPAMGSGHFLTNAVDHLAREIVNAHEKQAEEQGAETVDESHDIHWARRQVAQKCIYGVDLNDMAVELAKVSLWLRTLAAQQPLAFLDHHLKTGNSLIGSDIEDIEELETAEKKEEAENTTLEDFGMTKKGTMEDLMGIYQQIIEIENKELEDIKEMEKKYHKFEHEPIKERLEAMANVHTAREFGVDVPESAFSNMAKAIDDESKWAEIEGEDWFDKAQELAGDREFFHWKLAFPEVFYDEEGGKKEDAGFDAIIGNPPWVFTRGMEFEEEFKEYFKSYLKSQKVGTEEEGLNIQTGKINLYSLFYIRCIEFQNFRSNFGFIVPNNLLRSTPYSPIRKHILDNCNIKKIVDLGKGVFEKVTASTIITILQKRRSKTENEIEIIQGKKNLSESTIKTHYISQTSFRNNVNYTFNILLTKDKAKINNKIREETEYLGKYTKYIIEGIVGSKERDVFENKKDSHFKRFLDGSDISRYGYEFKDRYIRYDREKLHRARPKEVFENDTKIIVQRVSGGNRPVTATLDREQHYTYASTNNIILKDASNLSYEYILALLNSRLINWYYSLNFSNLSSLTVNVSKTFLEKIPIRKIHQEKLKKIEDLVDSILDLNKKKTNLNLKINDYLGNYSEGKTLGDFYTPVSGVSETILTDPSNNWENLRIGNIAFEENDGELILKASARYKPENKEQFTEDELDRWGYTETELIPAMKFTGSEKELALIREFTKLAVDKAGGFANFRESATKTMSILDRLEKLTLPKLDDVEKGLEKYLEQKEKAERLQEEIRETDHTIDAIVFGLYGLTEEEVEVVLDSLDTDEEEKVDIMGEYNSI